MEYKYHHKYIIFVIFSISQRSLHQIIEHWQVLVHLLQELLVWALSSPSMYIGGFEISYSQRDAIKFTGRYIFNYISVFGNNYCSRIPLAATILCGWNRILIFALSANL